MEIIVPNHNPLLLMRPTTVVSSLNLMKRFGLNVAVQSWVSKMWGAAFSVMVMEVLLPTRTPCSFPVRMSSSKLHREVLSPSRAAGA